MSRDLFLNFLEPKYYIPVLISIGTYLLLWLVKDVIILKLKKISETTETIIDDVILLALQKTKFLFILGTSIYIGFQTSPFDTKKNGPLADKLFLILFSFQTLLWGMDAINNWFRLSIEKKNDDPSLKTSFGFLGLLIKIAFSVTVVLFTLNNLGVNVSTFIAGLGVGGIAIALATQNILGDLFSSLSIVLDKPFIVGDSINLGEWQGEVEHIGLKTTRLRSLGGEQIIISNSDLLASKIRNYKRMQKRRVAFTLGVTYQAKRENLKLVPSMIKKIVEKYAEAEFDRTHFVRYGASSLDFEIVYWVLSPEYKDFADLQEKILFDIHEAFENHSLEFAYPTQTLFLEKKV
jgi:small-conductance mechanosensitive channel